jgi:hypothetical protein
MKTLKKTLSLTLVFALVFSLMSFAFAADTTATTTTATTKLSDFTDKDQLTYTEAADYLIAAGVVKGDTDTTLNPKGDLTREQAAKLIAYACLGQVAADNLKASTAPFTDVAADRWSAGYIAYCQKNNIINGLGDGTFNPTAKVTGYQYAKMLLCSLGYGVNGEFTGAGWDLEVAKYALAKDIFYGNTAGASNAAVTREEAFLYTCNALNRAMLVKYNDNLKVYYSGTNPFEDNQKFHEEYTIGYQRFKMEWVDSDGTYAEKAHYWAIDGKKVTGTYPNDPITKLASSADGTPYANLTAKSDPKYIGYSADDVCTFYINGDQQKTDSEIAAVKAAAGIRGNQVSFYDTDKNGKYDTVEVLVYKVVKLTSAPVIHTSGANDVVTIADMGMKNIVSSNIKGDYKGLAKDDYVLYFSNAKGTAWTVSKCETVTGQLFGYNDTAKMVNVNGTNYNVSTIHANYKADAAAATQAVQDAFDAIAETAGLAGTVFYLDAGKNIVAAEPTQNVIAADNVVFVLNAQTSSLGTVSAKFLKSDGTTVIKSISKYIGLDNKAVAPEYDEDDTKNIKKNTFYTFTEADGAFVLKAIASKFVVNTTGDYANEDKVFVKGSANFFKDNVKVDGIQNSLNVLGTTKTVFVLEGDGSAAGTYKAYTGVSNIPSVNAAGSATKAYVLKDKNGYAIMAVALRGALDTTVTTLGYAFVGAPGSVVQMTGNASENYYQYDYAVINGEIKKFSSVNTLKLEPGVYAINGYDGDKVDSVITAPAELEKTRAYTDSNRLAKAGNLATGFDVVGNTVTVKGDAATSFVVTDDVKVFVLDGYDKASGVVTLDKAGSIGAIENLRGDYYTVLSLRVSDKDNTINELFIGIQPKGTTPDEPTDPETPELVTYTSGTTVEVTLSEDADEADYVVIIGEDARAIVDGAADFAGVLEDGKIYTANLVALEDMDTVVASKTFVASDTAGDDEGITVEGTVTYISTDRGNFYFDIDGNDPVQLTGDARAVFVAFAGARDNVDGTPGNPFAGAEVKTVQEDGKITGFEYIKFANDVTLTTNMGAAFDGITIEGAKLNGTFTVNANDVTLKNLELPGTVTVAADVVDFTADNVTGTVLDLRGGGSSSVVLKGSQFATVKIDSAKPVRVVLEDTKVTSKIEVKQAGAKVEVDEDSAVAELKADAAVEVTGADKVAKAVVNAEGVVLDKAPGELAGDKSPIIGGKETSQDDLDLAAATAAVEAAEDAVEDLVAALDAYVANSNNATKGAYDDKYAVAKEKFDAAKEQIKKDDQDKVLEDYKDLDGRLDAIEDDVRELVVGDLVPEQDTAAWWVDGKIDFSKITKGDAIEIAGGEGEWAGVYGVPLQLKVNDVKINSLVDGQIKAIRINPDGDREVAKTTADGASLQWVHTAWGEPGEYTMLYYTLDESEPTIYAAKVTVASFEFKVDGE